MGITCSAGVSVELCVSHLNWRLLSAWTNPSLLSWTMSYWHPDNRKLAKLNIIQTTAFSVCSESYGFYTNSKFISWIILALEKLKARSVSRNPDPLEGDLVEMVGKELSRCQLDILGWGRPTAAQAVLMPGWEKGAWSSLRSPAQGRLWCLREFLGRWVEQWQKRTSRGRWLFSALRRWGEVNVAVCRYMMVDSTEEGIERDRNALSMHTHPPAPKWALVYCWLLLQ